MSWVPFNIARYEEYEHKCCQDPEGSIQVWILRILRLKVPIKWNQTATDTPSDCLGVHLKVGDERCESQSWTPWLQSTGLCQLILSLLTLFTFFTSGGISTLVLIWTILVVIVFKYDFYAIHSKWFICLKVFRLRRSIILFHILTNFFVVKVSFHIVLMFCKFSL